MRKFEILKFQNKSDPTSHGLNNNITASSYLRLSHVFIEDGKFTLAFPM